MADRVFAAYSVGRPRRHSIDAAARLVSEFQPESPVIWTPWRLAGDRSPLNPQLVVAYLGTEVVGAVATLPIAQWDITADSSQDVGLWAGRWWELAALVVHPRHRGQGLGGFLLDGIASLGARLGALGVIGTCPRRNPELAAYIESLGFALLRDTQELELIDPLAGDVPWVLRNDQAATTYFASIDELIGQPPGMPSYAVDSVDPVTLVSA